MRNGILLSIMSMIIFCSAADADLVDRHNGMVTDLGTGLMWQQTEVGAMSWTAAQTYCKNLQLARYEDWRIPNCTELQSIADFSKHYPAINTAIFPRAVPAGYWSSTPYPLHRDIVWVVDFADGGVNSSHKSNNLYVRAVRGGH